MGLPQSTSRHRVLVSRRKPRRICQHCESELNPLWGQPLLASSTHTFPERTIVTGASSNHFNCLMNLLYSLERRCPGNRVVVYDLGLSDTEWPQIAEFPVELRRFEFERHPPYFDINNNSGEYAWKPVIVHEVSERYPGLLMWLDAGNLVVEDLAPLWRAILQTGIVTPVTPGDVRLWTHPRTLQLMNVPPDDLGKSNRNAALLGLNTHQAEARELCQSWRDAALWRDCIAPEGSDRSNHRQDQAVLSALFYRYQREYGFASIDSVEQVSFHNDDLSRWDVETLLT
jgi:hypothetical protein